MLDPLSSRYRLTRALWIKMAGYTGPRSRLDNSVHLSYSTLSSAPYNHSTPYAPYTGWPCKGYSGRILHSGQHFSRGHDIHPHTPQAPFDLALRCAAVSNMPQIQFNDDGVWHDFAPEGRTALMPGPWFPGLILRPGDCLRDHCLDEPARVPRLPLSPVLTCQLDGGFTPISSEQPDSSN